jgi:hypothetical protein
VPRAATSWSVVIVFGGVALGAATCSKCRRGSLLLTGMRKRGIPVKFTGEERA